MKLANYSTQLVSHSGMRLDSFRSTKSHPITERPWLSVRLGDLRVTQILSATLYPVRTIASLQPNYPGRYDAVATQHGSVTDHIVT